MEISLGKTILNSPSFILEERETRVMGDFEIHPAGILLSLFIGYLPGMLFFGFLGGAFFGVLAMSSYILTVKSLDGESGTGSET